jgi:DNA-binding ferritin-like protein
MNKLAAADPAKLMNAFVSYLRALYMLHQNNHWQGGGQGAYGNHLLFERLYKQKQEDADAAAEKCIGLFGPESIDLSSQMPAITKIAAKFSYTNYAGEDVSHSYLTSSLEAEQEFVKFAKNLYDALKASDAMTLGLDDLIMSIASNAETSIYLLKQALR